MADSSSREFFGTSESSVLVPAIIQASRRWGFLVVTGVWAIVVAAGSGSRFGGLKQFAVLGGERVIDRAARIAALQCQGVVLVVSAEHVPSVSTDSPSGCMPGESGLSRNLSAGGLSAGREVRAMSCECGKSSNSGGRPSEDSQNCRISSVSQVSPPGVAEEEHRMPSRLSVVSGGVTRSESVRSGLRLVPDDAEIILVHDGARPLADGALYRRIVDAVRLGADVVVPALDIVDTMRWRSGGVAAREDLVAVQTPQGFRSDVLRAVHSAGGDASDDAALAEMFGYSVTFVDGDRRNLKITVPVDIDIAEALLEVGNGA